MTNYYCEARFCNTGRRKGLWYFVVMATAKTDRGTELSQMQLSGALYDTPTEAMQHGENAMRAHLAAIAKRQHKPKQTAQQHGDTPPRAS